MPVPMPSEADHKDVHEENEEFVILPEWVDGNQCQNCTMTFGVFTRKHHCRKCGHIFCDNCSSHRSSIPTYNIHKKVRLCKDCFVELNEGNFNGGYTKDMVDTNLRALKVLLGDELPKKFNDAVLIKYLIATDMQPAKAAQSVESTIRYNFHFNSHDITMHHVEEFFRSEVMIPTSSVDAHGWPIIVIRFKHFNPNIDPLLLMRGISYVLEAAIAPMENKETKVCIIADYSDWKVSQSNTKLSAMFLEVIQTVYPERLGIAYLINVPSAFRIIWKIIRPWLSKRTLQKVCITRMEALTEDSNLPSSARLREHGGEVELDTQEWISRRKAEEEPKEHVVLEPLLSDIINTKPVFKNLKRMNKPMVELVVSTPAVSLGGV